MQVLGVSKSIPSFPIELHYGQTTHFPVSEDSHTLAWWTIQKNLNVSGFHGFRWGIHKSHWACQLIQELAAPNRLSQCDLCWCDKNTLTRSKRGKLLLGLEARHCSWGESRQELKAMAQRSVCLFHTVLPLTKEPYSRSVARTRGLLAGSKPSALALLGNFDTVNLPWHV